MWEYPPRSILVAVDFGAASARALRVAQAMTTRHGSAITAIHAESIEVPPYFTHDQLREVARHRAETRRAAQYFLERALRLIGGAFVVVSVLLGRLVHTGFFWVTVFVGLNLFQSAFTNWCPMMTLLRKAGLRD